MRSPEDFSYDEKRIFSAPIKDLSVEERAIAILLSDERANWNWTENKKHQSKHSGVTVIMTDKLLENGVVSPLDGKTAFHNRRTWKEHLKANGCVEIGNDYNNLKKKTEIQGDFDCRKELSQAVNQVAEKYGH